MSKLNEIPVGRETNNPYSTARKLFFKRLKWDLRPEAFRSRGILKRCKNAHFGSKAVIVCNGPSLLKSDLTLLKGVYTFGLNKINLLFERDDFRPSSIVSVNAHVIEQNADFFNETEIPLFFDYGARKHIKARDNVAFLHSCNTLMFALDCSRSIHQGFTVTGAALQLAYHMGFRDVALIGCDHTFAVKGPANMTVESGRVDESHFDPRYFSGGQKWQLPDLYGSEFFYSRADNAYAAAGGRVVNATEGGKLEVFQRMSLADWVAAPAPKARF
ncbi:MAG: DUF115 domain-containing protein [Burkholderiales bacterium]|nr:DUF115 domain-containing protein [Opitutaceae bacterium]